MVGDQDPPDVEHALRGVTEGDARGEVEVGVGEPGNVMERWRA
jgi:hypothetical protein